jgi:hypothetical protein
VYVFKEVSELWPETDIMSRFENLLTNGMWKAFELKYTSRKWSYSRDGYNPCKTRTVKCVSDNKMGCMPYITGCVVNSCRRIFFFIFFCSLTLIVELYILVHHALEVDRFFSLCCWTS